MTNAAFDFVSPKVMGLHHIRLPVSDPMASSDWLAVTFGFKTILITEDEDMVTGTVMAHSSGLFVGLHLDVARSAALSEFAVIGLAVSDVEAWPPYLDEMGTVHSELVDAHLGKCLAVRSPDGLVVEIHTPVQPSTEDA